MIGKTSPGSDLLGVEEYIVYAQYGYSLEIEDFFWDSVSRLIPLWKDKNAEAPFYAALAESAYAGIEESMCCHRRRHGSLLGDPLKVVNLSSVIQALGRRFLKLRLPRATSATD